MLILYIFFYISNAMVKTISSETQSILQEFKWIPVRMLFIIYKLFIKIIRIKAFNCIKNIHNNNLQIIIYLIFTKWS
jgi:hypothetical protein